MKRDFQPARQYMSGDPDNMGYKFDQASQFIEFCVELDSQDDRMASPSNANFSPQINPDLWNPVPIYDSRSEVANDVIAFRTTGETAENRLWAKLYREILTLAEKEPTSKFTTQALAADPRYNGFGPYQSAWLLYEGRNQNRGAYAIAIRGTVFSTKPSVVEDVLFHPVLAQQFLSPAVSFASFNGAALHSGFTHATFSMLLDDRYGILRVLHDKSVPAHARLYIVGHSQGASMATLTHAFFHYAMMNATASNNPFDLHEKNYKLKSYVFAQPKPGNFVFAADFANITQSLDDAIVINNDIDPVPQVPLTLQDLADLDGDLPTSSLPAKVLRYIGGIGSGIRGAVGRIAEPIVRKDDAGYGSYFNYPLLGSISKDSDKIASSWNFTPAGRVMLVYGTPGDQSDTFLQHHAWTYRNLIRAQLRQ
jgi:Lipase (class 3)